MMQVMSPIRVLLVDDGAEFLEAVARFLTSDPEIEVVGQSITGKEALELETALKPDLVLMDLALPDISGLDLTRRFKSQPDSPRVIMLTLHDNREYRQAAEEANADGYVAKTDLGVQLLPMIHSIFQIGKQANRITPTSNHKSRL
jgi:two-component system nitrate/nitrite response regulator NarL